MTDAAANKKAYLVTTEDRWPHLLSGRFQLSVYESTSCDNTASGTPYTTFQACKPLFDQFDLCTTRVSGLTWSVHTSALHST